MENQTRRPACARPDWNYREISGIRESLNPNGPELLESLKLPGGGQMAPPSELTNYNPNAKTDVTLYSQLLKLTI